ncbi:MAG: glycosyltransferase [Verrucomicrobia bacterium]|nr:glycosyltransferase [Verrucomicrobiota bacterium]MDA1068036.1 glycosyltransferase [Verrucomicrobiota bacterium]
MRLFYDITKSASARQLSGLIRVSNRLMQALEADSNVSLVPVMWHPRKQVFTDTSKRRAVDILAEDCFLTPEVFSSNDRPGYYEALKKTGVFTSAIFHDAIPLQLPEITWPQSVARHPAYMSDLGQFDHVFSVSGCSQRDLLEYWKGLTPSKYPTTSTLLLGSDFFDKSETPFCHKPQEVPLLLCIGILEPRKNQDGLLRIACDLWDQGLKFELHFVGRVNPHFGKPIEKKIKLAKKSGYPVFLHSKQNDKLLLVLYLKARFTVFNSIAEGFGLPVVESLWLGVPCLCRTLPSLKEWSLESACKFYESNDELKDSLENWLLNQFAYNEALQATKTLSLPTWKNSAEIIVERLKLR